MKKGMNRLVALLLVLVLFLGTFSYSALEVRADATIDVKNGSKKTLINSAKDRKDGYIINFSDIPYNAKKVKIAPDKKSVVSIEHLGEGTFELKPKKAGTSKITATGVVNGKKIKRKCTIKIVNFKQPFKSLKIGGKDYTEKIKGSYNGVDIRTSKSEVKFSCKLNSEWKITEVYESGGRKIKSGKTYPLFFEDRYAQVNLFLKNKKSGETVAVWIEVEKK